MSLKRSDKEQLLVRLRERERRRSHQSLAYFAFKYCRTRDEHDLDDPLKLIPDKQYLRILFHWMQFGPEVFYVAKSRQLMVSWALAVRTAWRMLYFPHSRVVIQSEKYEKARELVYETNPRVARASLLLSNLPDWMRLCRDVHAPGTDGEATGWLPFNDRDVYTDGAIKMPNGAIATAVGQGASQVESMVPTDYICDEASLQEQWANGQAAAMPCLTGGGRGITVGTMRLPSDYGEEISPADDVDPDGMCRGVARFTSASGVPSLRIHYTADPDKDPRTEDGRKWFTKAVAGFPGGYEGHRWQQHMEINPVARGGTRVFVDWDILRPHVVIPPIPISEHYAWGYTSGFDWGVRNNTVWLVFGYAPDGTLYMVHELAKPAGDRSLWPGRKGGVKGVAAVMRAHPLFDKVNGEIYADPSIWKEDQQSGSGVLSIAEAFEREGVYMQPAANRGQMTDELLVDRLVDDWWSGVGLDEDFDPKFKIFETCTSTIARWPTLRYEEWGTATEKSLKEKIEDNGKVDEFDAMKYMLVSTMPDQAEKPHLKPPRGSYRELLNLIYKQSLDKKMIRS